MNPKPGVIAVGQQWERKIKVLENPLTITITRLGGSRVQVKTPHGNTSLAIGALLAYWEPRS